VSRMLAYFAELQNQRLMTGQILTKLLQL